MVGPIALGIDASVDPAAGGLNVRNLFLVSQFARIEVTATSEALDVEFRADLLKLQAELGAIFDLGSRVSRGLVHGTGRVHRPKDSRMNFTMTAGTDQLEYRLGERSGWIEKTTTTCDGYVSLEDNRPLEVDVTKATLEVPGLTSISGSGKYHLANEALECKVKVDRTDLREAFGHIQRFVGWEEPPEVSGTLTWEGKVRVARARSSVSGKGEFKNVRVEGGGKSFEQDITFAHAVQVDHEKKLIDLTEMEVVSDALSLRMRGKATRPQDHWVLDLTGSYEGSWEELTSLIHEMSPSLSESVWFTGTTGGDIRITGPPYAADLKPVFRDLEASAPFGWKGASLFGIDLQETTFTPVLSAAEVNIPDTLIEAGEGTIRIAGTVDLRSQTPLYRLPGSHRILDALKITPQMSRDLLSRFNPIFTELTHAEGEVSLDVEDLLLPLGDEIKRGGAGKGHLDLRNLKVRPKGILQILLGLESLKWGEQLDARVEGVDFVIRDGRIWYENFVMWFAPGYDLRFSGSVGFDDSLDLVVSVPVSRELLERLTVLGPVADYARVLEGVRVVVPLMGTRGKPRLDFAEVDIGPIIQRAIEILLREQGGKILGDLFRVGF